MTRNPLALAFLAGAAAPLTTAAAQTTLWVRQIGSFGTDYAWALAPDGAGGVLVAGQTNSALGGPFAGGFWDAWIARYDASGARVWIRQTGTSAEERALALASDGAGGAFWAARKNPPNLRRLSKFASSLSHSREPLPHQSCKFPPGSFPLDRFDTAVRMRNDNRQKAKTIIGRKPNNGSQSDVL